MNISDEQIRDIVQKVVQDVVSEQKTTTVNQSQSIGGNWGVFDNMNDAIEAAHIAFLEYCKFDIQDRKTFTDAVRQVALDFKEEFSHMAVEQTKMGRVEHKIRKHINVAKNSPGVEYLQPTTWTGKNGMAVEEYAPWGVIGNISPSTHPSPVMLDSIITQLAAGNTLVFNPHPMAKKLNAYVIQCCNKYMTKVGAPENLVTCVSEPTMESAQLMFGHPKTKLISITGGPGVVAAAMKYPKPVIAAGPGNPPALVDETADIENAAKEISISAGYDNNILCTAEKQIFVVESVFDAFMQAFERQGNQKLNSSQMDTLAQKALEKKGDEYIISRDFVGRNANVLARALGITLSDDVGVLFGETDKNHPWVLAEQMAPCIPIVRVKDFNEGLEWAIASEHGFEHTASIYTQDINRATFYAQKIKTDIVVVNGSTFRGDGGDFGEGYFSHTIASPTGQGIVTPRDYCRRRRIMITGAMRFV